jgi:hypothetical protein
VIFVEVGEEPGRSGRMPGDLEIVDMRVPVRANVIDRDVG